MRQLRLLGLTMFVFGAVMLVLLFTGSAVVMFAGLWIGILVPHLLEKFQAGYAQPTTAA